MFGNKKYLVAIVIFLNNKETFNTMCPTSNHSRIHYKQVPDLRTVKAVKNQVDIEKPYLLNFKQEI